MTPSNALFSPHLATTMNETSLRHHYRHWLLQILLTLSLGSLMLSSASLWAQDGDGAASDTVIEGGNNPAGTTRYYALVMYRASTSEAWEPPGPLDYEGMPPAGNYVFQIVAYPSLSQAEQWAQINTLGALPKAWVSVRAAFSIDHTSGEITGWDDLDLNAGRKESERPRINQSLWSKSGTNWDSHGKPWLQPLIDVMGDTREANNVAKGSEEKNLLRQLLGEERVVLLSGKDYEAIDLIRIHRPPGIQNYNQTMEQLSQFWNPALTDPYTDRAKLLNEL